MFDHYIEKDTVKSMMSATDCTPCILNDNYKSRSNYNIKIVRYVLGLRYVIRRSVKRVTEDLNFSIHKRGLRRSTLVVHASMVT